MINNRCGSAVDRSMFDDDWAIGNSFPLLNFELLRRKPRRFSIEIYRLVAVFFACVVHRRFALEKYYRNVLIPSVRIVNSEVFFRSFWQRIGVGMAYRFLIIGVANSSVSVVFVFDVNWRIVRNR